MEDKIVSLTGLFILNTLSHMKIKTAKETIHSFESNILDEIEKVFQEIINICEKKSVSEEGKHFAPRKKWNDFKEEVWGYECFAYLLEVKNSLMNTELNISSDFKKEVKEYYINIWPQKTDELKFKFSEAYLKKYKDYKKYEELSLSKIAMLTDGLIVFFFQKQEVLYKNYIKWMEDTDNFFCLKKNKQIIRFQYTQEEYNTIKGCVDSYLVNKGKEFSPKSFSDYINNIFIILDNISKSRLEQETGRENRVYEGSAVEDESLIRKDVENFCKDIFDCPAGTIGMIQDDIDKMFCFVADNTIESFKYINKEKCLTWENCKNHNGFLALMSYRLYSYLSHYKDNQFVKNYVKMMVIETRNKYGIYINEHAEIKNKVWIEEKCQIEKCYIKEECHISNSVIEEDVILHSGVRISDIRIKKGSNIGVNSVIYGVFDEDIKKKDF